MKKIKFLLAITLTALGVQTGWGLTYCYLPMPGIPMSAQQLLWYLFTRCKSTYNNDWQGVAATDFALSAIDGQTVYKLENGGDFVLYLQGYTLTASHYRGLYLEIPDAGTFTITDNVGGGKISDTESGGSGAPVWGSSSSTINVIEKATEQWLSNIINVNYRHIFPP